MPPPLTPAVNTVRLSAAEEARTIAAATNTGTLATLTADGDPWASFVTYGLHGGAPVLCVSNMAEHGRNLAGDQRASIAIVAPDARTTRWPRDAITLAGTVVRPDRRLTLDGARAAHLAAVPAAKYYIDYSDFTLWVLQVQRGPLGRRVRTDGLDIGCRVHRCRARPGGTCTPPAPSPISMPTTPMRWWRWPRTWAASPMPTAATCTAADRYGLDLRVTTPRGIAYTRAGYLAPINGIDELRSAAVELTPQGTPGLIPPWNVQYDSGYAAPGDLASGFRPDQAPAGTSTARSRSGSVSGQLSHDYIDGKYAIDTGERLTIVSRAVADLAATHRYRVRRRRRAAPWAPIRWPTGWPW